MTRPGDYLGLKRGRDHELGEWRPAQAVALPSPRDGLRVRLWMWIASSVKGRISALPRKQAPQ